VNFQIRSNPIDSYAQTPLPPRDDVPMATRRRSLPPDDGAKAERGCLALKQVPLRRRDPGDAEMRASDILGGMMRRKGAPINSATLRRSVHAPRFSGDHHLFLSADDEDAAGRIGASNVGDRNEEIRKRKRRRIVRRLRFRLVIWPGRQQLHLRPIASALTACGAKN
jgi:hypothetical protein